MEIAAETVDAGFQIALPDTFRTPRWRPARRLRGRLGETAAAVMDGLALRATNRVNPALVEDELLFENPRYEGRTRVDADLREHPTQVRRDRPGANPEARGDRLVRVTGPR